MVLCSTAAALGKFELTNCVLAAPYLGMQYGEGPSISHVANRFMGTGLLRATLPGKLSRPLLSAMIRAAGGTVRHRAWDLCTTHQCGSLGCGCGCVFVKLSRDTITVEWCERRRKTSFVRPRWARLVSVLMSLCRGRTAMRAAQKWMERQLSLLSLSRCSQCMRDDECR